MGRIITVVTQFFTTAIVESHNFRAYTFFRAEQLQIIDIHIPRRDRVIYRRRVSWRVGRENSDLYSLLNKGR